MRTSPQSTEIRRPGDGSTLLRHRREELLVVLRPLHPLEQELERLHRRHVGEEVPEQVHAVELVLVHEELFLAGRRALDVDGGVDAAVGKAAVEDELNRVYLLRNFLADMPPVEALEFLLERMKRTKNNKEFFATMAQ